MSRRVQHRAHGGGLRVAVPVLLAALAFSILYAPPLRAATPIPDVPADRVAVAGADDNYDSVRRHLAELESAVGAEYYVCVVAFTDPLDRPGYTGHETDYVEDVFDAWRDQIDPQRAVVVVVTTQNTAVAVQPGSDWVRLALHRGEIIDETMVDVAFRTRAESGDLAGAINDLVDAIDVRLSRLQQQVDELRAEVESRHAELTARLHDQARRADDLDSDSARQRLDEGRDLLERAQQLVDDENYGGAGDLLDLVASQLRLADRDLDEAHRSRVWRTVVLPLVIVLGLLILAVIVVWQRRSRWETMRLSARRHLDDWKEKLDNAGARLLALEAKYPLLLGQRSLAEAYTGETRELVVAVARLVDDLFIGYESAQSVYQRAVGIQAEAGWWSWSAFERVSALLTRDPVSVGTEQVKAHRLFLPEEREVEMTAKALLEHLDATYESASRKLEKLQALMEAVAEATDGVRDTLAAVETAEQALAERGVGSTQWGLQRARLQRDHNAATEQSLRDPLGALDHVTAIGREAADLRHRAEVASAAHQALEERILPAAETVKAEVSRLRREEGLTLEEPGFEPDVMWDRVEDLVEDARAALAAAESERARDRVAQAGEVTDSLVALVEATLRARDTLPDRIAQARERAALLRSQLPQRREQLHALRDRHADDALHPALDNIEEAESALDFADAGLTQAEQAMAPAEQRYLAADELLGRAQATLEQVGELYAEIDGKADELAAARERAERSLERSDQTVAELAALLEGEPGFASETSRDALPQLRTARVDLGRRFDGERPSWPRLAEAAADLQAVAQAALERADEENTAFHQVQSKRPEVEEKRQQVKRLLDRSRDDRLPANARFDSAEEVLTGIDQMLVHEHPDWIEVAAVLASADRLLDEARSLAESDVRRAEEARQAIARAERIRQRAGRSFGWGVRADLGSALSTLQSARNALAQQRYDSALRDAELARRQAEQAERSARQAARQRSWHWRTDSDSSSWWGGLGERSAPSARHSSGRSGRSSASSSRSHRSRSTGRSSHSSSGSLFGHTKKSRSSSSSWGSSSGRSSFGGGFKSRSRGFKFSRSGSSRGFGFGKSKGKKRK